MLKRRTKIVATISSLSCSVELIRKLHAAGMNVARLNTAHMTTEEAVILVKNIREVSDSIAIMIDTKGPNVRVCNLSAPKQVNVGDVLTVSGSSVPGDAGFQVNYAHFGIEVKPGQRIVVDDGAVVLEVLERRGDGLKCSVVSGGLLKDKKSVNVPNAELRVPALTKKDREFIDFAVVNNLDFIAHSFVRGRDDVMALQSILDTYESPIRIIAKIENRQGVDNLPEILDMAYGVMVARGDLGIEIPLEEVPIIQKRIIFECMRRHKPVITATQMLQSMETCSRPTRAEVSDVANAVMDGTDAVMLSGETANGAYPVESIEMMARIVLETEKSPINLFTKSEQTQNNGSVRDYMVWAAVESSRRLDVKGIVCNTDTGKSCNMCAAYRGRIPIFGLAYNATVCRQLALTYGVRPVLMVHDTDPHKLLRSSIAKLLDQGMVMPQDRVVLIGQFEAQSPTTDLISIVRPAEVM